MWGEMRGTFLCTQDELTVMKYGMLGCLIILSLVCLPIGQKKYTQNDIYARNFKTSSIIFDRLMAVLWFWRTG